MRHHIIHLFLTLIIGMACATVSCTSDPDPRVVESGDEIILETMEAPVSRASVTTTATLTEHPFRLFGVANREGEFHKGLRELFNDVKVTYKNKLWDYGVPQYWEMGQEHSFVAIHPDDIPGMSDLEYTNSEVKFTYTMPTEDKDERDVLFATHRRIYTLDSSKAVQFKFQHLLTKINVAPRLIEDLMFDKDDETKTDYEFGYDLIKNEFIQVRHVELRGFRTIAHVSIKPADLKTGENQTDESVVTVTNDVTEGEPIKFEFGEDAPHIVNKGGYVSLLDSIRGKKNSIVIIPQTFGENAELYMEYTVNTDIKNEKVRSITIPLKSTKLEFGKIYTLRFTIEKVYTGQIKDGSIAWELTGLSKEDPKHDWVSEDKPIEEEFYPAGTKIENDENNE